jgi:hypothetical protein
MLMSVLNELLLEASTALLSTHKHLQQEFQCFYTWRYLHNCNSDPRVELPAHHQTLAYYPWTIFNIVLIPLSNWAIFVSLDVQIEGLQMFFGHQK